MRVPLGARGTHFQLPRIAGKPAFTCALWGKSTLSPLARAAEARCSSGDPPLRFAVRVDAGSGQPINVGEKKATQRWLSHGGNSHEGLWDHAAACSIGEKGSPRLSATAL